MYDVEKIRRDFPILAREVNGENPGRGYIRVALVAAKDETHAALTTIRRALYD